ncbi:hypothetical protein [Enterococcus cecorum]|nr:hypothetical protein [Enterococcus cecorum]
MLYTLLLDAYRSTAEVRALTPEQVEWLMKGFSITPKILESQSRHFY